MAEKERKINPRSLENLKLGAIARNQGKLRRNTTLLPETIEWLEAQGNVSEAIDTLVAAAKKGEAKSEYTHERTQAEQQVSNDADEQMEALKAEIEQLRSLLAAVDRERSSLQAELDAANRQPTLEVADLEAARDRILSRWKLQKRAESKDRIKEALDKFIAELVAH